MENGPVAIVLSPRMVPDQPPEAAPEIRDVETEVRAGVALAPRMRTALSMLEHASSFAEDVGVDCWQFAVELWALRRLGLTHGECRWLLARGFAKHAREITTRDAAERVFQPCANLSFGKRTCFVITEAGHECLRSAGHTVSSDARRPAHPSPNGASPANGQAAKRREPRPTLPVWDADRQQLRVGRTIVKQFRVPAANQEAILAAFQEEDWSPRIDDPLSPRLNQDSKRRLHDTIKSLNRNQKNPLLRFLGDGKGEGVRWEFADPSLNDEAF
jgi:hypothetical protein